MIALLLACLLGGLVVLLMVNWLWPGTTLDPKGRTVLITGCDSGFGRALALQCAQLGMRVFAGCFEKQSGDELEKESYGSDFKIHAFQLDITDDESVESARKLVENKIANEGLYALVNNAGIMVEYGLADWCSIDSYKRSVDVNVFGMIRMTRAFKQLVAKRRGRIVNMVSAGGRLAFPLLGPYTVSKYGAEGYSETIRLEYAASGISVHVLEPGFFRSAITNPAMVGEERLERKWAELGERRRNEFGRDFFDRTYAQHRTLLLSSPAEDLQPVVDAYLHALLSSRPRCNYLVGQDARFLFGPFSFLPAGIQLTCMKMLCWEFAKLTPASAQKC